MNLVCFCFFFVLKFSPMCRFHNKGNAFPFSIMLSVISFFCNPLKKSFKGQIILASAKWLWRESTFGVSVSNYPCKCEMIMTRKYLWCIKNQVMSVDHGPHWKLVPLKNSSTQDLIQITSTEKADSRKVDASNQKACTTGSQ